MALFVDSDLYRSLRDQLKLLQSAPVKDMAAIDNVIDQLAAEQLRLKSEDGQHGNNPIEWRYRDLPSSVDVRVDLRAVQRRASDAAESSGRPRLKRYESTTRR
jgi:hypothetical protein